MPVVEFIVQLPAGHLYLSGINHDHKVPGVYVGREGGLGLAPQHHGDTAGQTTQDLVLSIHHVPGTQHFPRPAV